MQFTSTEATMTDFRFCPDCDTCATCLARQACFEKVPEFSQQEAFTLAEWALYGIIGTCLFAIVLVLAVQAYPLVVASIN